VVLESQKVEIRCPIGPIPPYDKHAKANNLFIVLLISKKMLDCCDSMAITEMSMSLKVVVNWLQYT